MKIKLIVNPKSGTEIVRKIKNSEDLLRKSGADLHAFITLKRGDAEVWAKNAIEESFERIIVAGGDGTINEVINGIINPEKDMIQPPIGIIPVGVSNVLALEIGIPLNMEESTAIAIKGKIKPVSLGISNGRYFSLMAGAGFDAEVVCRLNLKLKRYLGKWAYIVAGIKLIFNYKPPLLEIITDSGEVLKGYSAIVGKSKYYGGKFTVTPEAGIEKEELDLCLFQKGKRRDILRYVFGVLTKIHLGFKDVVYRKVKGLKITSQGRVPVQIDGDCFGELPVNISLKPEAVRLVFPKE